MRRFFHKIDLENICVYTIDIMPPTYEQNKKHIYKWREANTDRKKELDNKHQKKRYRWKKISIEFLCILI